MTYRLATAESVAVGHPDRLCDMVSDAVVDLVLGVDPHGRAAVETTVCPGLLHVFGEVRPVPDAGAVEAAARACLRRAGYDGSNGCDPEHVAVRVDLHAQSGEIAAAVDAADPLDMGAGDQGVMVGYATRETGSRLPLAVSMARALTDRLRAVRESGGLEWLRPDGKAQVTLRTDGAGRALAVDTVVVSAQHAPGVSRTVLEDGILSRVVDPVLAGLSRVDVSGVRLLVNPSGSFTLGGPDADSGLTGRKLAVDAYGPLVPVGGGALSGKDGSKTDRSGAYAARWAARSLVDAGLAERATVRVAYAIGEADPVMVDVDSHGTGRVPDEKLAWAVRRVFDLRPGAIVRDLGLAAPVYADLPVLGHFGRAGLAWEDTSRTAPTLAGLFA